MKTDYKKIGQLVDQAKSENSDAFTQLYEMTYQKLYFLALSILKNEADAEDALQETYIKISTSLKSLEDSTLFVAWANRIIYNICMRMLEKQREVFMDEGQLSAVPDDSEESSPLSLSILNERKQQLAHLIEGLEPVLKTSIMLKYYNNMKLNEIALVMNCPVGTVKSRLNTAKKQLLQLATREGSKDMWLNSISILPICSVLREAAKGVSLSPEKALNILTGSLDGGGYNTAVSFHPTPSAASFPATSAATSAAVIGGSVILTAAMVGGAASQLLAPSFTSIEVPYEYTAQPVSVMASVADFPKTNMVYAVGESGLKFEGVAKGASFAISIPENGNYTIVAVGENDKITSQNIAVTSIDQQAPELVSYSNTQDTLTIVVKDTGAGVDYSNVCLEENLNQKMPLAIDETSGSITFDLPQGGNTNLFIQDLLGNVSKFNMRIVTTKKP